MKRSRISRFGGLLLLGMVIVTSYQCSDPHPSTDDSGNAPMPASREAALKEFRDLKYGALVSFSPATQAGKEFSFSRNMAIPVEQYDTLYKTFNPTGFDAEEWVKMFKEVGFRYVVFVTKHHDGFALWDTKTTDYNIMHSPFRRDILKEFAAACKKYEMPLVLYYSIADFYQPDSEPHPYDLYGGNYGGPGYSLPEGTKPDYNRYVTYMKNQLKELTKNYGPVLGWWFDGGWQKTWTPERGRDLVDYMRKLQPNVLLNQRIECAYNDSVYIPTWFTSDKNRLTDFAVLELDMPRFNRDIAWEYTQPANARSYSWTPGPYADPTKWVDYVIRSACGDGNFILGISPTSTGRFEPQLVDKLRQMNTWLKQYGQSIFETRGGPYKRTDLYGSTCEGNKIFLQVFKPDTNQIVIPPLPYKIVKYSLLNGGDVDVKQTDKEITVKIGKYDFQTPSTIVMLEVEGDAEKLKPIGETPVNSGAVASSSNTEQASAAKSADGDMSTFWEAEGNVEQPWIEYDLGKERSISRAVLFEGEYEAQYSNLRTVRLQARVNGSWKTIKDVKAWGDGTKTFNEWPLSIFNPEIRFDAVTTRYVRLEVILATGKPVIHEFELYER